MNRVFYCHPVFSFQGDQTFSRMEEKLTCAKINCRTYGEKNKRSILTMPIVNYVTWVAW